MHGLTVDTSSGVLAEVAGAGAEADGITPLVDGQVGELVKTHLVGLGGVGVVGLDLLNHLDEDFKTLDELLAVLELELELLHVLNELGLIYKVYKKKKTMGENKEVIEGKRVSLCHSDIYIPRIMHTCLPHRTFI